MHKSLVNGRIGRARWGLLLNTSSLWIGAHYSGWNRRWCVNLLPCVTVWLALPGGQVPSAEKA